MGKDFHLYMVLAEQCPACTQFHKKEYAAVEQEFGSENISIISITSPQQLVNSNFVKRFQEIKTNPHSHPQVVHVRWTPAIGLVTKESWDNKQGLLEGFVYGGEMSNKDNTFVRKRNEKFSLTAEAVIQWVENCLETSTFKNYQQIITSPQLELYGGGIRFRHRDVIQ